nr:hypothetical protein Iba_chr13eCG1490 [Ipomoea batatas]
MADSLPSDFYRLVPPEISPTDYPPPDSSGLEFIEFSKNYLASLPKDLEWPSERKPEKSYEFERVLEDEEVLVTVVGYIQYTLKFRAKNMKMDGNPVEVFEVTGDKLIGGDLIIHKFLVSSSPPPFLSLSVYLSRQQKAQQKGSSSPHPFLSLFVKRAKQLAISPPEAVESVLFVFILIVVHERQAHTSLVLLIEHLLLRLN